MYKAEMSYSMTKFPINLSEQNPIYMAKDENV